MNHGARTPLRKIHDQRFWEIVRLPVSAISLFFDSSKIEEGVLSIEAFNQLYVSLR